MERHYWYYVRSQDIIMYCITVRDSTVLRTPRELLYKQCTVRGIINIISSKLALPVTVTIIL